MNDHELDGVLRISGEPCYLYAAERIEALRAEVERLTTLLDVYRPAAFGLQADLRTSELQVGDLRRLLGRAKAYTVRILEDQGVPAESWGMLAWQRDIDAGIGEVTEKQQGE